MTTELKTDIYKYMMAALVALFTIYVSYTQGSSQIDDRVENRVQQAVSNYALRTAGHDAEVDRRLARIDEKLDRLIERMD